MNSILIFSAVCIGLASAGGHHAYHLGGGYTTGAVQQVQYVQQQPQVQYVQQQPQVQYVQQQQPQVQYVQQVQQPQVQLQLVQQPQVQQVQLQRAQIVHQSSYSQPRIQTQQLVDVPYVQTTRRQYVPSSSAYSYSYNSGIRRGSSSSNNNVRYVPIQQTTQVLQPTIGIGASTQTVPIRLGGGSPVVLSSGGGYNGGTTW